MRYGWDVSFVRCVYERFFSCTQFGLLKNSVSGLEGTKSITLVLGMLVQILIIYYLGLGAANDIMVY